MKRILLTLFVTGSLAQQLPAQMVFVDPANLEQAILQLVVVSNQLAQTGQLIKQLGDTATIKNVAGVAATIAQLAGSGGGKPQVNVNITITGEAGMAHNGQGYFRPIEPEIVLADGKTTARQQEDYKKFAALNQAIQEFNAIAADTQVRRDALRAALRQTTERLDAATSDAEVQKLKGVQTAQQAELANISAERAEAAARVLIQHAANDTDYARQEQAELELRSVSLQSGLRGATQVFQADSRPTLIPDPRSISR